MNDTTGQHPSSLVLGSLALGQLDDDDYAAVEEHVASCATCAQVLARTQGDSFTALLQAAQSFSDTALPASQVATLATPMPAARSDLTVVWQRMGRLAAAAPPAELADHPRYRPLRLLGHGGMGAVWLAEHRLMGRLVAVKVIRPEIVATAGATERFQREANNAARLHHPNIVTAFDFDIRGNTHLLAMEYVDGSSLADEIRKRGALPVGEACAAIHQAARGLQHAHEKGVVHRDLKPQNLMRTPDGVVKILDFGLAVVHEPGPGAGGLTGVNMVVGTPDYIAPEQAEDSHKADFKSDVYALGCTLYYLLTSRVPFPDESVLRKLDAHRTKDPTPLRELRPEVPEDLAVVVGKMMAKRPGDRYASAAAVAEALTPFTQTDAPARPRRLGRLAAVAVLALAVCVLGWLYGAAVYRFATNQGLLIVETNDADVEITVKKGGEHVTIVDARTGGDVTLKAGTYQMEITKGKEGLTLSAREFTLSRGGKEIVRVSFDAKVDPKAVAKVGEVRRWDIEGHKKGDWVGGLAYSPDGNEAVSGHSDGSIRFWDVVSGKEIRRYEGHGGWVWRVAFSRDGKRLVSASDDKTARVWDVESGKQISCFREHRLSVTRAVFSPDGLRVVSGGFDKVLRLWDADTGKEVAAFPGHGGAIWSIAFSADGQRILSGDGNGVIRLWDLEKREQIGLFQGHTAPIGAVAFSQDGRRALSAANDRTIRLWNVDTGSEIRRFSGHVDFVNSAVFVPGERWILSASSDGTLRLWEVETARELLCLEHKDFAVGIRTAALSPDGRHALCGGDDKTLRLWQLPDPFWSRFIKPSP